MKKLILVFLVFIQHLSLAYGQENVIDSIQIKQCIAGNEYDQWENRRDETGDPFFGLLAKSKMEFYKKRLRSNTRYVIYVVDKKEYESKYINITYYKFGSAKECQRFYSAILKRKDQQEKKMYKGEFYVGLVFFQYEDTLFEFMYNNIPREKFDKYIENFKSCITKQ